jgi:autotransporter translocation and assembly factor TamB
MRDDWVSGKADATYNATASGSSAAELFSSATAVIKLEARDGSMPHIVLNGFSRPLQLRRFDGNLVLSHKELDFDESKLDSPDGTYEVTGTASLGRALHLRLLRRGTDGADAFNISGTLATPLVSASRVPETQVALKP